MWNGDCFDDAARAHLFRHRIHRANDRHRESGTIQFFANHSAAATAGSSRGDEQDTIYPFLAQIGGDLLAHSAHHCGRTLVTGNHIIGWIQFPRPDLAFGLQTPQRVERYAVMGIAIHIGDIVTAVHGFPFSGFQRF